MQQQDSAARPELPLPATVKLLPGPESAAQSYLGRRGVNLDEWRKYGGVVDWPSAVLAKLGLPEAVLQGANPIGALYMPGVGKYGHGIFLVVHPITQVVSGIKLAPSGIYAEHDVIVIPGGPDVRVAESFIKGIVLHRAHGCTVHVWNGINGGGSARLYKTLPQQSGKAIISFDSLKPGNAASLQLKAEASGAALLASLGYEVEIERLPPPPPLLQREQWGVDDYYAHYGLLREFPRFPFAPLRQRIVLHTVADILTRPHVQWIVKHLVPAGDITLVYGLPKCGKTTAIMDLLLGVAGGKDYWQGKKIKQHGPCVHITLEGSGLRTRIDANVRHLNLPADVPYYTIEVPITLAADADAIIDAIKSLNKPISLIAVDTVNRAMDGDENSSENMRTFLMAAEKVKLAFPGCGVVLAHHAGKDLTRGPRGSSGLPAWVGSVLCIESNDAGIRTTSVEAIRDATEGYKFNFTLRPIEVGRDEDGDSVSACVVEPAASPDTAAQDAGLLEVFHWIYRYWMVHHKDKPVSTEQLRLQFAKIRPKGNKMKREEFMANWAAIIMQGGWVRRVEGATHGQFYELLEPPQAKY